MSCRLSLAPTKILLLSAILWSPSAAAAQGRIGEYYIAGGLSRSNGTSDDSVVDGLMGSGNALFTNFEVFVPLVAVSGISLNGQGGMSLYTSANSLDFVLGVGAAREFSQGYVGLKFNFADGINDDPGETPWSSEYQTIQATARYGRMRFDITRSVGTSWLSNDEEVGTLTSASARIGPFGIRALRDRKAYEPPTYPAAETRTLTRFDFFVAFGQVAD
jgi:hypothetical protein